MLVVLLVSATELVLGIVVGHLVVFVSVFGVGVSFLVEQAD